MSGYILSVFDKGDLSARHKVGVMSRENYRLRKIAALADGRERVLDIGWFDKPNPFLANSYVAGLDRKGVENAPPCYSEVFQGDAMELPEPFGREAFDTVIAGEILEHLENPSAFLRRCCDVLSGDGVIILSTPNPLAPIEVLMSIFLVRKFFYCREHVALIPPRWLVRIMENSGFTDVSLRSGGFPLPFIGLVPVPWQLSHRIIAVGRKAQKTCPA